MQQAGRSTESWTPTTTDATLPTYRRCSSAGQSATASLLFGRYSRCNRSGATPSGFGKQFEPRWRRTCSDFHESHDFITAAHRELLPVQQTGSDSRSFTDRRGSFASIRFTRCWGVGEPRPGGRRAGRRWHSWECLAPACENLFLTTETAHILRDDETASRLLTESYSRCNRPGATPDRSLTDGAPLQVYVSPGAGGRENPGPGEKRAGRRGPSWGCLAPACDNQCLTTETAHILRDDETASLLLTVSYSRATKAPTPWHTKLHPDTSRSKISEQQCLAGPGSPHNDRSDGKPNSSWPGLPPQRQKFNKSKYDTNMTFAKFNKVC